LIHTARLEDYDLLPRGISPEWHVNICKWHAGVVADTAHDQVIADEQRILHRARRNHARLPNRAID
jgi:hypothetical protein